MNYSKLFLCLVFGSSFAFSNTEKIEGMVDQLTSLYKEISMKEVDIVKMKSDIENMKNKILSDHYNMSSSAKKKSSSVEKLEEDFNKMQEDLQILKTKLKSLEEELSNQKPDEKKSINETDKKPPIEQKSENNIETKEIDKTDVKVNPNEVEAVSEKQNDIENTDALPDSSAQAVLPDNNVDGLGELPKEEPVVEVPISTEELPSEITTENQEVENNTEILPTVKEELPVVNTENIEDIIKENEDTEDQIEVPGE